MKYQTGTKNEVLRRMAEHAIRDQAQLILAYSHVIDEEGKDVRDQCRANISDYKQFIKSLKETNG